MISFTEKASSKPPRRLGLPIKGQITRRKEFVQHDVSMFGRDDERFQVDWEVIKETRLTGPDLGTVVLVWLSELLADCGSWCIVWGGFGVQVKGCPKPCQTRPLVSCGYFRIRRQLPPFRLSITFVFVHLHPLRLLTNLQSRKRYRESIIRIFNISNLCLQRPNGN
jgi:hypothetical protein